MAPPASVAEHEEIIEFVMRSEAPTPLTSSAPPSTALQLPMMQSVSSTVAPALTKTAPPYTAVVSRRREDERTGLPAMVRPSSLSTARDATVKTLEAAVPNNVAPEPRTVRFRPDSTVSCDSTVSVPPGGRRSSSSCTLPGRPVLMFTRASTRARDESITTVPGV
eukprot:1914352-Prymnesium_polylepis.1